MLPGFLTQSLDFRMGSIRSSLVDAGNKNTAGSSDLPAVFLSRYSMQNLHQAMRPRNLYFNLQRFLKNRG